MINSNSRLIGIILICLGIFLVMFPLRYRQIQAESLPKAHTQDVILPTDSDKIHLPILTPTVTTNPMAPFVIDPDLIKTATPASEPIKILIPSVNIDLPVVESQIVNGYWTISDTKASHGEGSGYPGQKGNIVIFAHAKNDMFGPLKKIKTGANIYLLSNNRWYKYQVQSSELVSPTELSSVQETTDETLTLFTCSGFLDAKRLIVKAIPGVIK
jgi:sortase A